MKGGENVPNANRRIKALEKRVAALEAKNQAPQSIEVKMPTEVIAESVIECINRKTAETGKASLLL